MRRVAHGVVWFPETAKTQVLSLMRAQSELYSLNRHTAAALVIGRRGMGLLERQDFTVTQTEMSSEKPTLEGRGFKHTLSQKAYSWLIDGFCKLKQADLTGPMLAPGSRHGIGISTGETPVGESVVTSGRYGRVGISHGDERLHSGLGKLICPSSVNQERI